MSISAVAHFPPADAFTRASCRRERVLVACPHADRWTDRWTQETGTAPCYRFHLENLAQRKVTVFPVRMTRANESQDLYQYATRILHARTHTRERSHTHKGEGCMDEVAGDVIQLAEILAEERIRML